MFYLTQGYVAGHETDQPEHKRQKIQNRRAKAIDPAVTEAWSKPMVKSKHHHRR
jgi:hypothetical protein